MISQFLKCHSQRIITLILLSLVIYGVGRLYFQLTAGFTLGNILTDLSCEPDHGIRSLDSHSLKNLENILNQKFNYLGKGCQSYVFLSEDGQYVIKFLKYQRFRPAAFLNLLSFIPTIDKMCQSKIKTKRKKLDELLNSWKLAYEHLQSETGVIYVHLNHSQDFTQPIQIKDKIGLIHSVDPNQVVFLVQKSAKMLCKSIQESMRCGDQKSAERILDNLISTLLIEYTRGFGDNDHALMQNTGVIGDRPIHIDVGQISFEERFKNPENYKEEIFSKTYKFRIWLAKHYPELEKYLYKSLYSLIGPKMSEMKPKLKTVDEGA